MRLGAFPSRERSWQFVAVCGDEEFAGFSGGNGARLVGVSRERGHAGGQGRSGRRPAQQDRPGAHPPALTDDQAKKVDALADEYKTKKTDLDNSTPKLKPKEKADKIKDLDAELIKKIREVLTADQQPKFDAGQTLVADFATKSKEALAEKTKAVKDAAGDKDKVKGANTTYNDKLKALKADLDKALDEKVGKVGAAPAPAPAK